MIIHMDLGDEGYDIVLERGCLKKAGDETDLQGTCLKDLITRISEAEKRTAEKIKKNT